MVGDGDRFHTERFGLLEKRIDANRPVEQAVLRVDVQMNKGARYARGFPANRRP
jgi:hypothetical protein